MAITIEAAIEEFKQFAAKLGIFCPENFITDGRIHRFANLGNGSKKNGFYTFHFINGTAHGLIGDWKLGIKESWFSQKRTEFSPKQLEIYNQNKAKVLEEIEEGFKKAAARAINTLSISTACTSHPYTDLKGVKLIGASQYKGDLLLPLFYEGKVVSLQFISALGNKRYLWQGRKKGCYLEISNPNDNRSTIFITEGYATALSIYEATGCPVIVALDSGNLSPVVKIISEQNTKAQIVIAGDDDCWKNINTGRKMAEKAAQDFNCIAVFPKFKDTSNHPTDWNDLHKLEGIEAVRNQLLPLLQQCEYELLSMDEIQEKPVVWLWYLRIALGKITVIAGNPGLGKSQLTAWLCSRVTNGNDWPDTHIPAPAGEVIILSAEDDAADTIKPRLMAAGANLKNCKFLKAINTFDKNGKVKKRGFDLSQDIERLDNAIRSRNGKVRLVIIDPISAYLGKLDSNKNSEMRGLLMQLATLAENHNLAIVLITHNNKDGNKSPIDRVIGSIGMVAAARAAYSVQKDEANPETRYFLPLKNNIGNDKNGFSFTIEGVQLPSGILTSKVQFNDGLIDAKTILSPPPAEKPTSTNGAKEFLTDLLRNGRMLHKDVISEGAGMGYKEPTLQRAATKLRIKRAKEGMTGPWYWSLPNSGSYYCEDTEDGEGGNFSESLLETIIP